MVFRRDSKVDAFQRQISALRHQLGGENDDFSVSSHESSSLIPAERTFRDELPDLDFATSDPEYPASYDRLDQSIAQSAPSVPHAVPAVDTFTSVIAHTTSWSGNLESSGSLHIHGRVEGALTARDEVFIAEEAEVDANVTAANVTVAGHVRGSIRCSERFEVLPRGKVAGDVNAPVIVVHDGALLAGEVSMTSAADSRSSTSATVAMRAAQGGD